MMITINPPPTEDSPDSWDALAAFARDGGAATLPSTQGPLPMAFAFGSAKG